MNSKELLSFVYNLINQEIKIWVKNDQIKLFVPDSVVLKEEWKLFLDCKNNPDKKFSFDQHNKYIISETEEDNEDENDQLNKLKYFDDYLNLPSYEESQNDYIWSYNLKNDVIQNEIKIDKTRYVKLKNTYTI